MEKGKSTFAYTYSVQQQEEISNILRKYKPTGEDKMDQLRRLDQGVTRRVNIVSICFGIVSALLLGFGMYCSMIWTQYFAAGVIIGIVGLAGLAAAYPIYGLVMKRERSRIAPQIIALSNEIMN